MKALILAAGYATRLYPLTKEYPKPLLTVRERPIIDYILDKLDKIRAIDEIMVITNSKFILQFKRWAKGLKIKKRLNLIDDLTQDLNDRRGAIGDINFAITHKRIKDNLLIIGGDNLFNRDLDGFLAFAKANQPHPVIGAYNIKDKIEAKKYGVLKLNERKQLVDFQEKPKSPKSTLVAMCLYYFPKESLRLIKEYLNPVRNTKSFGKKNKISNGVNNTRGKYDATGFYIDWLRKKVPVYGFAFDGFWYDIGDHKFYREAKRKFTDERRR